MSVTCILYSADESKIVSLLESPETIHEFLNPKMPRQPSWLERIMGAKPIPVPSQPLNRLFDLGKSAEAIHWVLTGTKKDFPLPVGFLTSGGQYIGEEDVGYGPARALVSSIVADISRFLEGVTTEQFSSRVEPETMTRLRVYGAPLPDDNEGLTLFIQDYTELRAWLFDVSQQKKGIVIQYV